MKQGKRTRLPSYPGQEGFVLAAFITLIFGVVGMLSLIGYAIKNSQEYNRFHQIARDVADDPNSHPNEEILNSGDALVKMMNQAVQSGATAGGSNVVGGLGVQLVLQAEDALNDVRNQQFVIKIVVNPVDPAPFQTVTVTITVVNSVTGTPVHFSVVGSDGFTKAGTLNTDQNGQVSFTVPGGAQGVVDTITVTVDSVKEEFTYKF